MSGIRGSELWLGLFLPCKFDWSLLGHTFDGNWDAFIY